MDEYERLRSTAAEAVRKLRTGSFREVDERLERVLDCKRELAEYVRTHTS